MELELGLKITHNRDDLSTKMADLRITKDASGPIFMSRETESNFILIGHLKGFRRENIDIEINEDGSRVVISGKRPVQEIVLMNWIMHKKEAEIRAFMKVFRIPDGVVLDKIKAKFNEEISTLTIIMPKLVIGILGVEIEEVEGEKVDRWSPATTRTEADKVTESTEREKEEIEQESRKPSEREETDHDVKREVGPGEPEMRKVIGYEIPEKDSNLKASEEGMEDSSQVVEEAIDKGESEATKAVAGEFPERGTSGETVQEKPEQAREAEMVPERVQESLQKDSKEPEVKSSEVIDQVVEESQGRPEVERHTSIEKVEPAISKELYQETGSMEPEEEAEKEIDHSQVTKPPPTEETQREKLPEERAPEQRIEEQVHGPESIESTSSGYDQATAPSECRSPPSSKDEKEHHVTEIDQAGKEKPEELPKKEPGADIQKSTKPESFKEPELEETLHPKDLEDQADKEDVQGKEETQGNELEEKATDEEHLSQEKVDEHGAQEVEKEKGLSEDTAQVKNHVPTKPKVCTPLVVAGSALIVSLIVLVIHFIRAKKR